MCLLLITTGKSDSTLTEKQLFLRLKFSIEDARGLARFYSAGPLTGDSASSQHKNMVKFVYDNTGYYPWEWISNWETQYISREKIELRKQKYKEFLEGWNNE